MTRNKILTAIVGFVALVGVLIWVRGGFHSKVPGGETPLRAAKPPSGKTVTAELMRTTGEVTVSGTVVSRETARVAARILGYVVELKAEAGDKVRKGDVLLRIDTKDVAEREAQAKAALESAKADLAQARTDFERYKALFEKEAASKKAYDDARTRYEVAQAAEQRAAAALDEAKTNLSYGTVTAPFDGIVSERLVNLGDLATPGRALFAVYMPGTLELVAPVGEQYYPFLKPGVAVTVAIPSADLKEATTIREVVPQREEKTRTITVKAPIKEREGLGPGLYGTLTFETRAESVVVIPKDALKTIGQLESVQVLENGTVVLRHVRTGRALPDNRVEILSGLNAGEKVVMEQGRP